MWERLWNAHINHHWKESGLHALILSGDQIYADSIWKEVPYFKKHKLLGRNSTKKVINHPPLDSEEKNKLKKSTSEFYETAYIKSWGAPAIAKVLSSIPTIMMWDDHDIFDGWGSHQKELQETELFEIIGNIARKYFETLQIRGKNNPAIFGNGHYSQHINFRNYEIIALDNRTFRRPDNIMPKKQFKELEALNKKNLFKNTPPKLQDDKTLLFVISVPLAHMNFHKRTETFLKHLIRSNFQHKLHLNDDGLDHWDHETHQDAQKKLVDLIFNFGERHKPKFVSILSGDVHCAGSGRIKRIAEHKDYSKSGRRDVNQLVTSPISYEPTPWPLKLLYKYVASETTKIKGYSLKIDPFGYSNSEEKRPKIFYQRNYGVLFKDIRGGIQFWLDLEQGKKPIPDPLASYEKSASEQ